MYEQWKVFLSWAKSKPISGTEPPPVGEKMMIQYPCWRRGNHVTKLCCGECRLKGLFRPCSPSSVSLNRWFEHIRGSSRFMGECGMCEIKGKRMRQAAFCNRWETLSLAWSVWMHILSRPLGFYWESRSVYPHRSLWTNLQTAATVFPIAGN